MAFDAFALVGLAALGHALALAVTIGLHKRLKQASDRLPQ